jgi:hypothetical protein
MSWRCGGLRCSTRERHGSVSRTKICCSRDLWARNLTVLRICSVDQITWKVLARWIFRWSQMSPGKTIRFHQLQQAEQGNNFERSRRNVRINVTKLSSRKKKGICEIFQWWSRTLEEVNNWAGCENGFASCGGGGEESQFTYILSKQ